MYRNVHLGVGGGTVFAQHSNYPTARNASFRSESPYDARRQSKVKCPGCGVWAAKGGQCTLCATAVPGWARPANTPLTPRTSTQQLEHDRYLHKLHSFTHADPPLREHGGAQARQSAPRSSLERSVSRQQQQQMHPPQQHAHHVHALPLPRRLVTPGGRSASPAVTARVVPVVTDYSRATTPRRSTTPVATQQQRRPSSSQVLMMNRPPLAAATACRSPAATARRAPVAALGTRSPNVSLEHTASVADAARRLLQQQQQQQQQHHHQRRHDATANSLETYRAVEAITRHQQQQLAACGLATKSAAAPAPPPASGTAANASFYELYRSMLTRQSASRSPSAGRAGSLQQQQHDAQSAAVKCAFCGTHTQKGCMCRVCHMRS